jgi:hypothetical protein
MTSSEFEYGRSTGEALTAIARCPDDLPAALRAHLVAFAEGWARHAERPAPSAEVAHAWDTLIADWIREPRLPLLVRKSAENRGEEVSHSSGRTLVPVDNSPAQWVYALACAGEVPTLADIEEMLAKDQVPVAMVLKKAEREKARYRRALGKLGTASAGWKLGHLQPVGLGYGGPVETLPIDVLMEHFRALMSPSNMFVVPLAWAGLAEIPEVLDAMRRVLLASD